MDGISYIGEHLTPGYWGHFCIILGFVSAILSFLAYTLGTNHTNTPVKRNWKRIGRWSFVIHGLSFFTVIGVIFYIMANRYYEYHYVLSHVSDDLSMRYILSAFWEGQEGSFLLWMFWHIVLGGILIWRSGKWEMPVMAMMALTQAILASMVLGVYITDDIRIGSNPLLLTRDVLDLPLFASADYVKSLHKIADGLNPLLQNYWMTIHPPTLFLGFSSTLVPFAYAIAGLWLKEHNAWLRPALPWALFSGAILGTGILMGGAWAYEALSFGGYWAWDPVENMSLVPWLVLIAGLHTNLVARATHHAIKSTYLFYILTFLLILYSTFLTRSGVLGETSVHAFTEMGLEWQLVILISTFTFIGLGGLLWNYRSIPSPKSEESLSSREFWMFVGSMVLLFSAALITLSTSLPVYNKIVEFFNPTFEGVTITDPVDHHNKFQLWVGTFIAFLSSIALLLPYRGRNWASKKKNFVQHIAGISIAASLLFYGCTFWLDTYSWQYGVLLFSGLFSVAATLNYLFLTVGKKWDKLGSTMAHLGFGLMLVGIVASGLNKQFISTNPFAMRNAMPNSEEEDLGKNILLIKGRPLFMSGYEVTYERDTMIGLTKSYTVDFKKLGEKGEILDQFQVAPNILFDNNSDNITPNPSTKRYLSKDIFTHIVSLPRVEIDPEYAQNMEDSLAYETYSLAPGDTAFTKKHYFIFDSLVYNPVHADYEPEQSDLAVGASFTIKRLNTDSSWTVTPFMLLRNNLIYPHPVKIDELEMKLRLSERVFEQAYTPDRELEYELFQLKIGESFQYQGYTVNFTGFNQNPVHPNYIAKSGDIAVSAMLSVQGGQLADPTPTEPLYLIRDNRPFNIKTLLPGEGLHFRFSEVNPKSEEVSLEIAKAPPKRKEITVEVAENAPRSDYIVLEAIEFPGINLFWIGSVFIMLGMVLRIFKRLK